jgi:hypothetical protein
LMLSMGLLQWYIYITVTILDVELEVEVEVEVTLLPTVSRPVRLVVFSTVLSFI